MKKVIILLFILMGFCYPQYNPNDDSPALWIAGRFSNTISGSDSISSAMDSSANGRDMAQATQAQQPIQVASQLNGYTIIKFDGTDDQLTNAAFPNWDFSQAFTIVMVMKFTTVPSAFKWVLGDEKGSAVTAGWALRGGASDRAKLRFGIRGGGAGDIALETDANYFDGNWKIVTAICDGSSDPDNFSVYSDITSTAITEQTEVAESASGEDLALGARPNDDGGDADIQVAELIIFPSALTAKKLNDVWYYLNQGDNTWNGYDLWDSLNTYHVSNDGDDNNSGLFVNSAWKTVATVNSFSHNANDTVAFFTGDTWREQLTVPASGTSGNVITFTAVDSAATPLYGSDITGAKPIISGADTLSSGWGQGYTLTSLWTAAAQSGTVLGDDSRSAHSWRTLVDENYLLAPGDSVRFKFTAHSTEGSDIDHAAIGVRSGTSEDYTAAGTRITFDGDNGIVLSAGDTIWSDVMAFVIDSSKDHLVHTEIGTDKMSAYWAGDSSLSYYTWATLNALTADITADGSVAQEITMITEIENVTGFLYVWERRLTTEPSAVWFDETLGTLAADSSVVDSTHEWYWADDTLYVYSTTNPTTAFTNPGVGAHQRDYGIYINNKDYLTIDNLEIKDALFGIWSDSKYSTYSDNNIHDNHHEGIRITGSGNSYITVDGDSIYNQGNGNSSGIWIGNAVTNITINDVEMFGQNYGVSGTEGGGSSDLTIDSVNVHDHQYYGLSLFASDSTEFRNILIENSTFDNNGIGDTLILSPGNGYREGNVLLWYGDQGIIRYNNFTRGMGWGIDSKFSDTLSVYYNLFANNFDTQADSVGPGVGFESNGGKGVVCYNNVFYNNTGGLFVTNDDSVSANITYKNNIFFSNTSYDTSSSNSITTITQSNNIFDPIDPLFTNASGSDFTLQKTSPCIDAGVDVSLTTDYAGNTVPATVNRQLPDIGAYEYLLSLYKPLKFKVWKKFKTFKPVK